MKIHMKVSKLCKIEPSVCGCKRTKVWLVPQGEKKSSWDKEYITKELYMKALDLHLTGDLTNDDEFLLKMLIRMRIQKMSKNDGEDVILNTECN